MRKTLLPALTELTVLSLKLISRTKYQQVFKYYRVMATECKRFTLISLNDQHYQVILITNLF